MKKKMMLMMAVMIGLVLAASSVNAAVFTGATDLLNGAGDFDDAGDQAMWTLSVDNASKMSSAFQSDRYTSASYAWEGKRIAADTKTQWARLAYTGTFDSVSNRSYKLQFDADKEISSGSYNVQTGFAQTSISAPWSWATLSYVYTQPFTKLLFHGSQYAANVGAALYLDNVILSREVALPTVTAATGAGSSWTLSNEGGSTEAGQLIAFDPDVTVSYVSGFDVGAINTTWTSDNALYVTFENQPVGAVTLQITNPNGDAAQLYTIPEPMTLLVLGLGGLGLVFKRK